MSRNAGLDFPSEQPADQALAALRARLAAGGSESPALDARCLIEAACGIERSTLVAHGDRPLGAAAARLRALAKRRLAGEPLARILGHQEFWGLGFSLSAATLVPRPETETLVEAVLRHCDATLGRSHGWSIADLGTGSGCIGIALLSELPRARLLGIDRSTQALATARRNAKQHAVGERARWIASDWTSALNAAFDIVVSNPPYVVSADIQGLSSEVREHDPLLALDGGADGLDSYRSIAIDLRRILAPGACVFLEIGFGQEAGVRGLLAAEGLAQIGSHTDLGGRVRVISARRGAYQGFPALGPAGAGSGK